VQSSQVFVSTKRYSWYVSNQTSVITQKRPMRYTLRRVNVLSEEKKQQVIALGRLGWSLRRIQQATRIRRDVIAPDIYDATLNPLYRDVLKHYGAVALSAHGDKVCGTRSVDSSCFRGVGTSEVA
jgi:hypothetical protein